jgi:hypothetical protein
MYTYYIIFACAVAAVFLFMMWRDVRTLKSRVTDVVEQHNNVKKVLDRHESMLAAPPSDIPFQFAMEPPVDAGSPIDDEPSTVEIKEEPVEVVEKPKTKKAKTVPLREKDI